LLNGDMGRAATLKSLTGGPDASAAKRLTLPTASREILQPPSNAKLILEISNLTPGNDVRLGRSALDSPPITSNAARGRGTGGSVPSSSTTGHGCHPATADRNSGMFSSGPLRAV